MNLEEIKEAVRAGKKVHWSNELYEVIEGKYEFLINCVQNDYCIGLTHRDGITMNGRPEQFFIGKE